VALNREPVARLHTARSACCSLDNHVQPVGVTRAAARAAMCCGGAAQAGAAHQNISEGPGLLMSTGWREGMNSPVIMAA
jgi:hypothetical protein